MPGPIASVALAAERQLLKRAYGMNGIEMPGDQNAGLALFWMREAGADAAGETLSARDALDARAHDRHVARGDVEHALDGGGIPGRTFAFHPVAQTLQHDFGVKRKIGWVHGMISLLWKASGWDAYEHDRRGVCKARREQRSHRPNRD